METARDMVGYFLFLGYLLMAIVWRSKYLFCDLFEFRFCNFICKTEVVV